MEKKAIINSEIKNEYLMFGKYKITLKHLKQVKGHDDSLPFEAILYVNNKKCCSCFNDGWGGSAMLTIIDDELFKIIDDEVTNYPISYNGKVFGNYTLSDVADELACLIVDNKKRWNIIKKEEDSSIIFDNNIATILYTFWVDKQKSKYMPISKVLEYDISKQKMIDVIERYKKQGYKVLNTNIPKELL